MKGSYRSFGRLPQLGLPVHQDRSPTRRRVPEADSLRRAETGSPPRRFGPLPHRHCRRARASDSPVRSQISASLPSISNCARFSVPSIGPRLPQNSPQATRMRASKLGCSIPATASTPASAGPPNTRTGGNVSRTRRHYCRKRRARLFCAR